MDAVKLSAVLIALAFLIAFVLLLNVKSLVLGSVKQITELKDSLFRVKIQTVSETQHNLTFSIYNPFNLSIHVYNATGQYVTLQKSVTVPPMETGNFTILISNSKEFYSLAQARQENITLYVGIGTFNFTESVNL
ncbi:hypothetical protein [Metallosphaera hakonensis]|uniref:Uncharacterized protein n=1 Tax=Metallosphaera hakonensis JCM 8857 = DSM 7519 TaxID=1293036 RepID=A0A2U9IT81_9CREN|nr:hypothetical protein [Metallosphaera hakonensis]AWR99245.1 hypothetical protein DFR87_05495 [Metallosphaera hakonensis JCM 8857 = DSM 7519]